MPNEIAGRPFTPPPTEVFQNDATSPSRAGAEEEAEGPEVEAMADVVYPPLSPELASALTRSDNASLAALEVEQVAATAHEAPQARATAGDQAAPRAAKRLRGFDVPANYESLPPDLKQYAGTYNDLPSAGRAKGVNRESAGLPFSERNQALLEVMAQPTAAVEQHNFEDIIDDEIALLVRRHPQLTELDLADSPVTARGLAMLAGLVHLKHLSVSSCPNIDGAALAQIAALPSLNSLDLESCWIADADMVHVGGMLALDHLFISGTRITDVGFAHLQNVLAQLRTLEIAALNFTDQSMVLLGDAGNLRDLRMQYNCHGDSLQNIPASVVELSCHCTNLADLSHLHNLRTLELRSEELTGGLELLSDSVQEFKFGDCTGLPDPQLDILAARPNLTNLTIEGFTGFSPEALARFARQRPDVTIDTSDMRFPFGS